MQSITQWWELWRVRRRNARTSDQGHSPGDILKSSMGRWQTATEWYTEAKTRCWARRKEKPRRWWVMETFFLQELINNSNEFILIDVWTPCDVCPPSWVRNLSPEMIQREQYVVGVTIGMWNFATVTKPKDKSSPEQTGAVGKTRNTQMLEDVEEPMATERYQTSAESAFSPLEETDILLLSRDKEKELVRSLSSWNPYIMDDAELLMLLNTALEPRETFILESSGQKWNKEILQWGNKTSLAVLEWEWTNTTEPSEKCTIRWWLRNYPNYVLMRVRCLSKEDNISLHLIQKDRRCNIYCREFTMLRNENGTRIRGRILKFSRIGPVSNMKICHHGDRYSIEVQIPSLFQDNTVSWVRIVKGVKKYVTESMLTTKEEDVALGHPVQKQDQDRSPQWRHVLWSVKSHHVIATTWSICPSRNRRSDPPQWHHRRVQEEVRWCFAMIAWTLEINFGKGRRSEEKISFGISSIQTLPVNSCTF